MTSLAICRPRRVSLFERDGGHVAHVEGLLSDAHVGWWWLGRLDALSVMGEGRHNNVQ